MEIKETLITPATATTWLEGNTHNRALRDATVQRYARDMAAGRWRLTHQGIAFGPDGTLIDGQHRLWAIVEADTAIRMMVARGVPADAQAVIDDNLPRTAVDALKLRHNTPAKNVEVAIAKRIISDTIHNSKPTRQEVIAVFTKHQPAIAFAASVFPRIIRGVTIAPVMTVIARAWYSHDRDRLARFAEILCTGRLESDTEDAALMLRNWLLEGAPVKKMGIGRDVAIYGKTERALSAFLHGDQIAHLYAATSELFPIPLELQEPRTSTPRKLKIAKAAPTTTAAAINGTRGR